MGALKNWGPFFEKHWLIALVFFCMVPQLFIMITGMLCNVWPRLLKGSFVYLIVYIGLMIGGLFCWGSLLVRRFRKKQENR
mgnify:CR=1 FL=1